MTAKTGQQVARAASVLGVFSILVTALGFFKNLLAAYYFGTSRGMDVYILALTLPDLGQYLSITGLFNFIPLFAKARAEQGEDAAWSTAGKLVTFWLLLLTTVLLVCAVAALALSWLVAPGLEPHARGFYVLQTRLLCLMALPMGTARILAAVHNARKRFFVPSVGEAAFQVGSILYLVVFHDLGTVGLVGGMVFGGFCQLFTSALDLGGTKLHFDIDLRHEAVRRMVGQSVPVYFANAAAKVASLVTSAFASTLSAGMLSALQYAMMPVEMVTTTIGLSLTRALFPFFAEQHAEGRRDDAARTLERAIVATVLALMPVAGGLWLLARPAVTLLYQRGSFGARSADLTAVALQFYAPLLLATCISQLMATFYYAQNDTRTPTRVGLIRVALALPLCALLVPTMGYRGLALTSLLGEGAKATLMIAAVRGGDQRRALRSAAQSCLRLSVSALLMVVVVYPLSRLEPIQHIKVQLLPLAALGGTISAGALVYLLAVRVLAKADFDYFLAYVRAALHFRPRAAEAR